MFFRCSFCLGVWSWALLAEKALLSAVAPVSLHLHYLTVNFLCWSALYSYLFVHPCVLLDVRGLFIPQNYSWVPHDPKSYLNCLIFLHCAPTYLTPTCTFTWLPILHCHTLLYLTRFLDLSPLCGPGNKESLLMRNYHQYKSLICIFNW